MVELGLLRSPRTETKLVTSARIVAAIPCYNTQGSIYELVKRTQRYVDEVVVVDDGSTDLTADYALSAGASVIKHKKNCGKGAAMKTAARKVRADILIFIDGDGQHDPKYIPQLIEPIVQDKADFVIGSRFLADSESFFAPADRRVANFIASLIISFVISFLQPVYNWFHRRAEPKNRVERSRLKIYQTHSEAANYRILNGKFKWISDCTSGFSAMRLNNWDRLYLESARFQIETEILFEQARNGFIIAEVPISCSWEGSRSNLSVFGDGTKTVELILRKLIFPPNPRLGMPPSPTVQSVQKRPVENSGDTRNQN